MFIRGCLTLVSRSSLDLFFWVRSTGEVAFKLLKFDIFDRLAKDCCTALGWWGDFLETIAIFRLLVGKELLCTLESLNVGLSFSTLQTILILIIISLLLGSWWIIMSASCSLIWITSYLLVILLLTNLQCLWVRLYEVEFVWILPWQAFWGTKLKLLTNLNREAFHFKFLHSLLNKHIGRFDILSRAITIRIAVLLINIPLKFIQHDVNFILKANLQKSTLLSELRKYLIGKLLRLARHLFQLARVQW